jgi:hypothetical protein
MVSNSTPFSVKTRLTSRHLLQVGFSYTTTFVVFLATIYSFCPEMNFVHGPAFMSRNSGFCQENSG